MACVVNGPGESKAANIGISCPARVKLRLPGLHRRRALHHAAGTYESSPKVPCAGGQLRRHEISQALLGPRIQESGFRLGKARGSERRIQDAMACVGRVLLFRPAQQDPGTVNQ